MQSKPTSIRYVVVLTRLGFDEAGIDFDDVVIGPFRRRERAEARAATVRRLAEKYDDILYVSVERIRGGNLSAQDALDFLYGSIVDVD